VSRPRVALFAPHPLLSVTLELEGEDRQSIHFHAAGQGVWSAGMVSALGATPELCGLIGGEPGELLRRLIEKAIGTSPHLVESVSASGCYVVDRRSGVREPLAMSLSDPPSRHELDELFSLTCAQALECGWLIVTNPLPDESLPLEVYRDLVADARAGGARTLVDLSSPRLDSALEGEPDLVKINDYQLAELVRGEVSSPEQLLGAARRLQERGAREVVITRGEEPALVLHGEHALRLEPPHFERGFREGCGDAMMGALAAVWASGEPLEHALVMGAAAGAANFLRRGLGHASREVVEQLADSVTLSDWQPGAQRSTPAR
jgi:1-phosphofructokinase